MKKLTVFFVAAVLLVSCSNSGTTISSKDSAVDKTLVISIDESFEPVMKEQLKVFEMAYPDTKVIAEYKPEAACLRDLQKDSTKIVIISRELSREETLFFENKIAFKPEFAKLAKDAIAVIINSANKDSVYTIEEMRKLLAGEGDSKLKVAIDGNTATSTVRYLKDSVLKGGNFGKNINGAKGSEDLVRYIATTEGAIGFVGISWITNPQSKEQEDLLGNVKFAMLECNRNCEKDVFAKPSQQTITFGQYPLVRGLYYVLKENYAGMGSRLIYFLSTERGQLIFRRASIVPTRIDFHQRRIRITG